MLLLHGYWLSLATYRVRAALKRKGVAFEERMHAPSRRPSSLAGISRAQPGCCRARAGRRHARAADAKPDHFQIARKNSP